MLQLERYSIYTEESEQNKTWGPLLKPLFLYHWGTERLLRTLGFISTIERKMMLCSTATVQEGWNIPTLWILRPGDRQTYISVKRKHFSTFQELHLFGPVLRLIGRNPHCNKWRNSGKGHSIAASSCYLLHMSFWQGKCQHILNQNFHAYRQLQRHFQRQGKNNSTLTGSKSGVRNYIWLVNALHEAEHHDKRNAITKAEGSEFHKPFITNTLSIIPILLLTHEATSC